MHIIVSRSLVGNSASFPARTKHKLQAMRASFVVRSCVLLCSVAWLRLTVVGGFKIATELENRQTGAHAKVKLSLLILDSTRATRIKCSNLDNGTA